MFYSLYRIPLEKRDARLATLKLEMPVDDVLIVAPIVSKAGNRLGFLCQKLLTNGPSEKKGNNSIQLVYAHLLCRNKCGYLVKP